MSEDIDRADNAGQLYSNQERQVCEDHGLPLEEGFCDACHAEYGD